MKLHSRYFIFASYIFAISPLAIADDLPRHGVIGLAVDLRDPTIPANPSSNALLAKNVVPGGAADAAGIHPGDTIISLDSETFTSPSKFALAVSRHIAGDTIHLQIIHNGQSSSVELTLKPRPFETSPDAKACTPPS